MLPRDGTLWADSETNGEIVCNVCSVAKRQAIQNTRENAMLEMLELNRTAGGTTTADQRVRRDHPTA